ncbi:MAG: hypothetical protein P1U74_00925 [Legionellaceae bacterium]|nr:hypothetical protein [Legionellaceae bacterium]
MDNLNEEISRIIICMEKKERVAIIRMMQDKVLQFEYRIQRGVIAMLNAPAQRQKLAEKRAARNKALDEKSQRNKEQLSSGTSQLTDITENAPMGMGNAAKIGASIVNGVGSAVIDHNDATRNLEEAEKDYYAAQFLDYVDEPNYKIISERVSSILGYRFQFLIFRLAAGEDGFFKLADFFIECMKLYALDKLEEHVGELVQSFIDAAIPSPNSKLRYSEWKWGENLEILGNKTLQLDPKAEAIIAKIGPAPRSLLGGYIKHNYTILGMLNHAAIVNHLGEIRWGLQRPGESLDGRNKYPVILLGRKETTANMGLGFATFFTDEELRDHQVVAIRRLVPDFFEHTSSFEVGSTLSSEQQKPDNPADLAYYEERYEYSWDRDPEWNEREDNKLNSQNDTDAETEEMFSFDSIYSREQRLMKKSSTAFDITKVKQDVIRVKDAAVQAQVSVYDTEYGSDVRTRKQLEAAIAAKYAAIAVSNLMRCIVKYGEFTDEYRTLVIDTLESAGAGLNASRELPLQEASRHRKQIIALKSVSENVEEMYKLKLICQNNFHNILDVLHGIPDYPPAIPFLREEEVVELQYKKALQIQSEEILAELEYCRKFAMAVFNRSKSSNGDKDLTADQGEVFQHSLAIGAINATSERVKDVLYDMIESDNPSDINTMLQVIERCVVATKKNHEDICAFLQVEDNWVVLSETWTAAGNDASRLKKQEIQDWVISIARHSYECASNNLRLAQEELAVKPGFIDRYRERSKQARLRSIFAYKQNAVAAKLKSTNLVNSIKLSAVEGLDEEIKTRADQYFERAMAESELGKLRFVARKKFTGAVLPETQAKQELDNLDLEIRKMNLAIRKKSAIDAKNARDIAKEEYARLNKRMTTLEYQSVARNIYHAKEAAELAVVGDLEIPTFVDRKSNQALTEIREMAEHISDIKSRLKTLQARCLADLNYSLQLSTSDSMSDRFEQSGEDEKSESSEDLSFQDDFNSDDSGDGFHAKYSLGERIRKGRVEITHELEQDVYNSPLNLEVKDGSFDELFDEFVKKDLKQEVVLIEESSPSSSGSGGVVNKGRLVQQALLQIINNIDESIPVDSEISRENIRKRIAKELIVIKEQLDKDPSVLGSNWAIRLLVDITIWVNEVVQSMPFGVRERVSEAKHNLPDCQCRVNPECEDLQIERQAAMKKVNQAYLDIYEAKTKMSENARKIVRRNIEWDPIADTFEWAGTPYHRELYYVNSRLAANPPLKLEVNHRTPMLLLYLVMHSCSRELLSKFNKIIVRINALNVRSDICSKRIYDLNHLSADKKELVKFETIKSEYEDFSRQLELKYEQITWEIDCEEQRARALEDNAVSRFFREWQEKTCNPEAQTQRVKAIKEAKAKRMKLKIADSEAVTSKDDTKQDKNRVDEERVVKLREVAKNITTEDLEAKIVNLEKHLRRALRLINPKKENSRGPGRRKPVLRGASFYSSSAFDLFGNKKPGVAKSPAKKRDSSLLYFVDNSEQSSDDEKSSKASPARKMVQEL